MCQGTVLDVVRVLLDNNQWNFLIEPPVHAPLLGLDFDDLRRACEDGSVELVGTLDLLQEIIGTARNHAPKYRSMVDAFFDLTGPRLLIPLSRRHTAEARAGGLLPETQRYFDREARRSFRRMARSRKDVLELGDEVYEESNTFKKQELIARQEVQDRLDQAGERLNLEVAIDWFNALDINEWLMSTVEAGVELGHYSDADVDADGGYLRYPSALTFTAARLARIVYTVGGNRRVDASDLADAHHVASGPYVDVIVTDDERLRQTFALMSHLVPFRLLSSLEFANEFGVTHASEVASRMTVDHSE